MALTPPPTRGLQTSALLRLAALFGAFAVLLTLVVILHPAPLPGDTAIARAIQRLPVTGAAPRVINLAGDPYQWAVVAAAFALVLSGRRLGGGFPGSTLRREALWAIALAAALCPLSSLLKRLADSPRPTEEFGIVIDRLRDSPGFPSGHVYGDVLLYGALAVFARAFLAPRLVEPFRVLALALCVLAGPARIAVGAHWPVDTLGGYLWGLAALCLVLALARRLGRRTIRSAAKAPATEQPLHTPLPPGR